MIFIAGPCSIESYDKGVKDALKCKELGIEYFRAGAFKPRTNPTSFQGLREDGIKILEAIKRDVGIKIVTEIVAEKFLPLYENIDILQIGSRNCQNFELLKTVAPCGKPILLKRGFGMTIDEFIGAADYLKAYGATDIILCERGIRSFEPTVRNILDIGAIVKIKNNTDYKIIADPSHSSGNRDMVIPFSKAAIAAGADGLIVEATESPSEAISDGFQTINYSQLQELTSFYLKK